MNETMPSCWMDEVEDELVRELLDDESPLFILPEETLEPNLSPDQSMDPLVSNLYSGTMILGLEDALSSVTAQKYQNHAAYSQSRLPIWERNLSKMEDNKYTLRLKCCGGNRMADDGYKWRKYGQKSIKNSPYPRSYYRCTNPQCCAKKQVERSREDEDTLIITYEGLHLHFAYPYFLPKEPPSESEPEPEPDQQTKRAKSSIAESEPQAPTPEQAQQFTSWTSNGLLEDVVPFMVRNPNPSSSSSNNTYSSSSCSSYRSSSASPSSLSWSPTLY